MYTKGKKGELWYVDNFVTSKGIFCDNSCFDGGRSTIAIMQKLLDGNDESNAALMAAAPDLLAACELALDIIRVARNYFPKSIKNPASFNLESTNAAIGKAVHKAKGGK